jgi:hypothetical protein
MTPTGSNLSVINGASADAEHRDEGERTRPPGVTGEIIDSQGFEDPFDDAEWLTAADILGADDVVSEVVVVPEWTRNGRPGKLVLRSIDGDQRDRYLNSIQYTDSKGRQRYDLKGSNARLLCMAAFDMNGRPLFKLSQWDALNAKNAAVVERLAAKARKMGGLGNLEDEEEERNRREGLG